MKEIRQFMKVCKLSFGWISKTTLGLYDSDKKKVKINIALSLIRIFIHEYIHETNPKATEKQVVKKTARKLHRLKRSELNEVGRFIVAEFNYQLELYIQKRKAGES